MTETAMKAALEKAGYRDGGNSLYVLACQMLAKSGLNIARCQEALKQAWQDMRKPGEGHSGFDAHGRNAQTRQDDDGGEGHGSRDAQSSDASTVVSEHDGGGQSAGDAQSGDASPIVHRMPRGIASIAGIQKVISKAVIFRTTKGKDIMDVKWHELGTIERKARKSAVVYAREAIVARYLIANVAYANPDPFAKVGDLFPVKTIEMAVAEAEKERPDAA